MAANGINVARAYVEIIPSTKGVGTAIIKAFNDANTTVSQKGAESGRKYAQSFNTSARNLGQGIGQKFTSIGGQLKSMFNRVAVDSQQGGQAAGSGFARGFGLKMGVISGIAQSITGRLLSAFSGLGGEILKASDSAQKFGATLQFAGVKDKEIRQLTKSTQDYADKTVYELEDIRNTTAQLASNGVKNYAQLAQAAGNLNAAAGGNRETFKSVALVLTQTAAAGKLTGDNWRQLSQAIPGASGMIQKQLQLNGVYTGSFADAMRKGKISSDDFNKALMQLGFTDVAQKAATSTKTIEGAWGNLQASVVKTGMVIFDTIKAPVTGVMSAIGDAIANIANSIQAPLQTVVNNVSQWFGRLWTAMQNTGVISALKAAWDSLCAALNAVGATSGGLFAKLVPPEAVATGVKLLAEAFKGVCDAVRALSPLITPLAAGFAAYRAAIGAVNIALGAWRTITTIATGVQTAFNLAMDANPLGLIVVAIGAVVAALTAFFTQTDQGRQMWQQICDGFNDFCQAIAPTLQQWWDAASQGAQQFGAALMQLCQALQPVADVLVQGLQNAFTVIGPIIQGMTGLITGIIQVLTGIIQFITGVFTGNWGQAWQGIQNIFGGIWNGMSSFVGGIINGISTIIGGVLNTIQNIWNSIWNGISSFFSNIWNGISSFVGGVINGISQTISNVINGISQTWTNIWNGIKSFFSNIWNGIKNGAKNGIDAVVKFVTGLKDKILGFFSNAGKWLINAGKAILDGLLGGLKGAWDGVCKFVGDIAGWIMKHKGPVSYDRKILIPAGRAIMTGFSEGLTDSWHGVQQQVHEFTNQAGDWFNNTSLPGVRLHSTVIPPDGGWDAQRSQLAKVAASYEVDATRNGISKQDLQDTIDAGLANGVVLKLNARGGEVMAGTLAKPLNNELHKLSRLGR